MRRRRASMTVLGLCLLLSAGLNLGGLLLTLPFLQSDPFPPVETVTMLELNVEPDPKTAEPEPEPQLEPPKLLEPPPKPRLKPQVEFEELPEPEPEQEPEPEPEPEPQPQEPQEKMHFVLEQMKMVEQPDELDEADEPEDANYLSNINRDVTEETRAEVTNLEQDAIETKVNPENTPPEEEVGTAAETKIAQTQQQESQLAQKAPKTTPEPDPQRARAEDAKPQTLLSMRELAPRSHQMAQDPHEALADEADDGMLQPDQKERASLDARQQQARVDRTEETHKFKFSSNDLDAMFGKDMDARRELLSQEQTRKKGFWEGPRAHWQSPLENMVPEVQVGNQTALRSRRDPFARYIATIHRSIHDGWAWGFLDQLDTRGRGHPLNDYELWTRLELVISADGQLEKATTVRHSGNLAFDAAAREVAWAAGPFPPAPPQILSGNGKVYIHWAFHRNERACGTFGATPFILDNAGAGDRPDPNIEVVATRGGRQALEGRRLEKPGKAVASGPEGPAPPPSAEHTHLHPHPSPGVPSSPGSGGPPSGGVGTPGGPPIGASLGGDPLDDPRVKQTADEWLHFMAAGDLGRAMGRSAVPFHAGETVVARTQEELRAVLKSLYGEVKEAGRPKGSKVYRAADLRRLFGSVPAGVQEGEGRAYALTKIGDQLVIILLERNLGSWRVAGLAR